MRFMSAGDKPNVLSLVISATIHAAAVLAFVAVSQHHAHVFNVDLVIQASEKKTESNEPVMKLNAINSVGKETKQLIGDAVNKSLSAAPQPTSAINNQRNPAEMLSIKAVNQQPADETAEKEQKTPLVHSAFTVTDDGLENVGGNQWKGKNDLKEKGSALNASSGNVSGIIEAYFGSPNGPSFSKMIRPKYPDLARRLGKEGKVMLRLLIDERGQLIDIEQIEKAGYGLDEAAIEAAKAASFHPARLNGHPVACRALLPVKFKLER